MPLENTIDSLNSLSILEEDDYLTQFLKFSETDKGIFSQLDVEEQIVKLNKGLEHVETLICNQVFKNHEELLNQVTWIENLESIINNIASQLQNLQSSVELLKSKIVELYAKVQTQVVILNRLHTTCDLLRKIMRIQNLSSNALGKENTLSQNIIFEIKELLEDKDLKCITFMSKDLTKLSNIYEKVLLS